MSYRVIQRATPPMVGTGDEIQPSPFAVPIGGGYYHVEPRYVLEPGDTLVADDINASRWATLAAKAPAHAQAILRAKVYRRADGQSLRAEVEADEGVTVEKKVPQSGNASRKPADPVKAAKALARAKALHDEDPESVTSASVPMAEVLDGDVVDADMMPPHHWSA